MVRRFAVPLLVAALLVTLFLPATLAAGESPPEAGSVASLPGADDVALDRLRTSVAPPGQARDVDGSRGGAGDGERARPRRADRRLERPDADGVLEQSTRAAVYRAVRETPGRTLHDVADAVGVTKSTVRYHARVLREAGLVETAEVSGALRLAPADADVELHAALRADGTGAVLGAVAANEPASVTELARATDRAPSTVSHHLSSLADRGLVERERDGEAVVTTLAPTTRTAMAADPAAPADD